MIHHPISFAQYRALEGVPNSLLKYIDRSPMHLATRASEPIKPTPAMLIGSLTDHLLFGTELAYTVSPYDDYRSKEARQWRDEQNAAGIAVFKQEDIDAVQVMVHAIQTHPAAADILSAGRSQVGLTGTASGVTVKGLVDWISDNVACLTDLKTTGDASPREFSNHAVNMGYDAQAAYYVDLWEQNAGETLPFVWIVAENEAPHAVAVYVATDEMIARGRRINESRLARYAEAVKTGAWPGYPDTIQPLTLPPWAQDK